ncbi:hypothetical protein K562_20413 [Burkholderia cenocepacia]|nr:hypothetical protein K562_20413 [Burkholderia cenocepacia]
MPAFELLARVARERRERHGEIRVHVERAGRIVAVVLVDQRRVRVVLLPDPRDEAAPGLVAVERQQRVIEVEQREILVHEWFLVSRRHAPMSLSIASFAFFPSMVVTPSSHFDSTPGFFFAHSFATAIGSA